MHWSVWRVDVVLSALEEQLTRQARQLETLTADVTTMETQLQQMLRTLSELRPETVTCNAQ